MGILRAMRADRAVAVPGGRRAAWLGVALARLLVATAGLLVLRNAAADNAGLALAPRDAGFALDARGLSTILDGPAGEAIRPIVATLAGSDAMRRLEMLARRTNAGTDVLAREVFSGRIAFHSMADAAEGSARWMIGIEAEDDRCERVLKALGARLVAPGRYTSLREQLAGRRCGGWLLLMPLGADERLFDEAQARVTSEDPASSLLGEPLVQPLLGSDAPIRMFLRHSAPIGGATAVALRPLAPGASGGAALEAVVRGDYLRSPFGGPVEPARIDARVMAAFEDRAAFVVASPSDGRASAADAFWLALVPEFAPSPAMRANYSGERVVAIGEQGRASRPAMAMAWRVEDAEQGRVDQHALMRSVCCGLQRAADLPSDAVGAVPATMAEGGAAEHCTPLLGPFLDRHLGDEMRLGGASLCWTTRPTGCGGWQVYASDGEWLDSTADRLERAPCEAVESAREVAGIGFCDGPLVASLIRRWRPLAGDGPDDRIARGLEAVADAMSHLGRMRFEYTLPNEHRIDAVLRLEPRVRLRTEPGDEVGGHAAD